VEIPLDEMAEIVKATNKIVAAHKGQEKHMEAQNHVGVSLFPT
jgi:hypothetical protein